MYCARRLRLGKWMEVSLKAPELVDEHLIDLMIWHFYQIVSFIEPLFEFSRNSSDT
jgi:hypothetical protein